MQRVRVQTNGAELKYSIHLAHAQTKCPYAIEFDYAKRDSRLAAYGSVVLQRFEL